MTSLITLDNWQVVLRDELIQSIRAQDMDKPEVTIALSMKSGARYLVRPTPGSKILGGLINITAHARPIRSVFMRRSGSLFFEANILAAGSRSQFIVQGTIGEDQEYPFVLETVDAGQPARPF